MAAALFLIESYLYDFTERIMSQRYAKAYRSFPIPTPEERLHNVSDVSLIVPAINWDESFTDCIATWLSNNPLEITIVTIESHAAAARALVAADAITSATIDTTIQVLVLDHANKRDQLVLAINAAQAPFQQTDVGIVGGPIASHVPEERQDPAVITPWEVAALRIRQRRGTAMHTFFAADGSTNFTLPGCTMLLRAEILKDAVLQREFTNDNWMGVRQDTGDDSFITSYVLFQHLLHHHGEENPRQWKLGMQLIPEAGVHTGIATNSTKFASQMKRWSRSGLRFRLTCLFYTLGLRLFWKSYPYMVRKMAEGMMTPVLTVLWFTAWFITLRNHPIFACLVALRELGLKGQCR
ncbi:Uu.00g041640.m01.CDS01 [Anthostomella pinea]|uniref:Uu.00g041640.m01.CDS01 n=1 Tax=Anthostomella pinea TaxID=933095 RepID=A0AAI8VBF9_9PEZI|nr:Uu.00g041640.m01.CDS01 [Anthostomella pinea]